MRVKTIILLLTSFLLVTVLTSISAEENQISNQGLVAYYSFDEGTGEILHDLSGNNHDGTIFEGTWTDGISGKAIEFNGINSYVSLPASTIGNWDSLTYSIWVKSPEYTGMGWPAFFGSYTTSFTYNNFIGISRNTQTLHMEIDTDAGNFETNGILKIPWNTWVHVALVYDSSQLTEYINGEQGISISASGILKNVSELNIGQLGSNRYFFKGLIDEAHIFNRALSEGEVKSLYESSAFASNNNINENYAAEKSPLNLVMDKKYVPFVATVTSVSIIYLWNIFGSSILQFFKDYISSHIRGKKSKNKKIKKKIEFSYKFIKNIDIVELFSMLLAITVFAITMSWTWSADMSEFFNLFLINFIVISCILGFREISRLYYSQKYKLKTQYVFWPFGALLTIISTFLGNTFSLTFYIVFEEEKNIKKFGKMYFNIYLILYTLSLITFTLHFFIPLIVLQMIFSFSIMGLFIFLAPIKPMTGYNIKKWNFKKWSILYAVVFISYIIMNFTLYK